MKETLFPLTANSQHNVVEKVLRYPRNVLAKYLYTE